MKYEITYLVETEAKSKAFVALITATGATYSQTKDWGVRDLAYPINNLKKAYYYTGIIDTLPSNVVEIKKKLNFSDVGIRYLITKIESK